jgi:hypothetical protein
LKLNNKVYDVLKWVALIALPAFAVFYSTVGSIWHLPNVKEISDTVIAVDVFLGALLQISSSSYRKDQNEISGG